LACLAQIGAANLTIRHFDNTAKFLEDTISCEEIEQRLKNRLSQRDPATEITPTFNQFLNFIKDTDSAQKYASGKAYFFTQFNRKLKEKTGVTIQLNNHKQELARILKNTGTLGELDALLQFIIQ
jgi:hypothetical protein